MKLSINVKGITKVDRRCKGVKTAIENAWDTFTKHTRVRLKAKSPAVSKNFYRHWNIPPTYAKNGMVLDIRNEAPYASAIVFGCAPGEKPWPSVGPKTMMADGRIHSSMTVGDKPNIVAEEREGDWQPINLKINMGTFEQSVLNQDRLQNQYDTLLREELKELEK